MAEIDEIIKDRICLLEKYIEAGQKEMEKYKSVTETDDKFEISKFSFWRATILQAKSELKFLKELLKNNY